MNIPPGHEVVADACEDKEIGYDELRHGPGLPCRIQPVNAFRRADGQSI
jgi:hypothetical protein